MASTVREIERKYEPATAGVAALDAVRRMTGTAGVTGVSQRDDQLLDALYYDTADLRLIRAGITLRRRTGGEDAGWHLKLPAGADTRDEIRLPLAAPGVPASGAVPGELAALVQAYARGAALAPVVRIQTSRRVVRLLDSAGRALAEVSSDQVLAEPADGSAATSWEEIEAELVTGGPGLLEAIDVRLRHAGAQPAATRAKLQRALAGRLPAAAPGQEPSLTGRSPAAEVVLAYLREQVTAITRCDPLVRRDEPDAVHQMRVASRRARSALQAFGCVIERDATRPLCAELRWLAAELGQARDGEVLQDRLAGELAALPSALVAGPVDGRISAHFGTGLAQARQSVLLALNGARYLRLLDGLDALLADPPLTRLAGHQARKALAKPVRRAQRRLERALAAVPRAGDRDAVIHDARKAAKRARYAAEAAQPALASPAAHQAARAKRLQQLLGDHHDSVVARALLLSLAGDARDAGEDTFTYGVLYQRQACQAAAIEHAIPSLSSPER